MSTDTCWRKTRWLTCVLLAIWVFFTFVLNGYADDLNTIDWIGFPLGFYMAAQGSPVIYPGLIWHYNRRMRQIETEFGIDGEQRGPMPAVVRLM